MMVVKILFLAHRFYPDLGGIEVNSEILAHAFHNAGHTVHLLTWSEDDTDKEFPYEVKRRPDPVMLIREHLWADVIYENNLCLRLAWPSIFFGKPGVVALRTWVQRNDGSLKWQDKLKRMWLKRASSVIAVSESVRKGCWPQASVIGNPYRSDTFRITQTRRDKSFVFLGRLVSDKGVHLAIQALHQLLRIADLNQHALTEACSLTVIGDGPEQKSLTELAADLGMTSRVFFKGSMRGEVLVSCLNEHKYMLVPSVWEEPFGNVALEGLACGCVPIVSDGGGLPDAVGPAGLVFPSGNVDALSQCMLRLLGDPALEKRLRDAAPDHLSNHHPDVVAARYLCIIVGANKKNSL